MRLAVRMCVRLPLSLRNVEDLLHERGIEISHETVRFWWNRFGPMFASEIGKKSDESAACLFELAVAPQQGHYKVNGETHYLWRAVDHEGADLERSVTKRRDRKAGLKFSRRAMKRHGRPHILVTDKLRSYGAAMKVLGNVDKRKRAAGLITKPGIRTSHLDEETAPCYASGRCEPYRNSSPTKPQSTTSYDARRLCSRSNFKLNNAASLAGWRGVCAPNAMILVIKIYIFAFS